MTAILVASLIGALLFFAAGVAWSTLRQHRGARFDPLALQQRMETAEAAHAQMVQHRDAAVTDAARLQAIDRARTAEIDELRRALEATDDRSTVVRSDVVNEATAREVQALRQRAEGLAREVVIRDTATREVGALRARVETAEADATALRASEQRLRSQLEVVQRELTAADVTIRQLRTVAEERTQQIDRTRTESIATATDLDQAQTRLRDIECQLAERTNTVRDLATENEQLKGRVRDADALRGEYVRLRTAATESEFLKSEIVRLEKEVRAMRVDALGAQRPRPARGTDRQPTGTTRSIGESLSAVIDRFADAGTRSIAIGDVQGFPLASSGADGVALAAYAALLIESATRAKEFLPVGVPSAIEIIDEKGARVSVWAVNVESERMMLANLAVTPVDTKRLESTLAELTAILAPSKVASGSYT